MKALPSLSGRDAAASPSRAASAASPLVSSTAPPASEDPSPTDLLLATPPALIKLFALSAPVINVAATFALLVTWKHPNFWGSLLVLLAWWGVCLFGYWVAVYGINAAILAFILVDYLSTARRGNAPAAASLRHRPRPATLSPAAYAQLLVSAQIVAEHVQAFRTSVVHPLSLHFSFSPLRPSTPAPAYDTAWFLVTSYPFYLALTFFVPVKYLFLALGTVAILWQAPFFTTLRTILWSSAFVRWACHLFVGVLRGGKGVRQEWSRTRSGLGIPGLIGSVTKKKDQSTVIEERPVKLKKRSSSASTPVLASPSTTSTPPTSIPASSTAAVVSAAVDEVEPPTDDLEESSGEDVEVQFTVFENQRWWVGLDWTQALLPGERASWTDADSNPANPPAAFVLPQPSVTYVPSPTKADPNSRLKKTTEWRWIEPEWHVLRSSASTVVLPVGVPGSPNPTAETASASGQAGSSAASPPSPTIPRILGVSVPSLAGATSSSSSSGSQPPMSAFSALASSLSPTSNPTYTTPASAGLAWHESNLFSNWQVDDEGWQYGDNHFEKMGPRGGLGKYTRRRAWVRRAGLVEKTERISGPAPLANSANAKASAPEKDRKKSTATAAATAGTEVAKKERSMSNSRPATTSATALRAESPRKRRSVGPTEGGGMGAAGG
ncbi:hypothetical protein JCM10908_000569 [Rhodotorula pacifica]|uniref:uncharacterized protein n=1 Tax=Rhodotorula pacifica TaxID=1495444 RepID=UPI0031776884